MGRPWLPLTLAVAALTLSACLDDPAVRERLGVDENGRPVGPSVAPTAGPATPDPAGSPVPSPAASAPEASPAPSASPAQPGVTGRYDKTFDPLDLAIAGPGYLMVARRPDPQSFSDVLFTREGALDLVYVANGSPAPGGATVVGPGEWRLQTQDGLRVMGYSYEGPDGAPPPAEMRSTNFQSLFQPGGAGRVGAIAVDTQANLNFAPHFNFKGQLLSQQRPPTDLEGDDLQIYVAIVQFERPAGLKPVTGFPGYMYAPEAGVVSVGIAGVTTPAAGVPRPVGDANLIRPETLER